MKKKGRVWFESRVFVKLNEFDLKQTATERQSDLISGGLGFWNPPKTGDQDIETSDFRIWLDITLR